MKRFRDLLCLHHQGWRWVMMKVDQVCRTLAFGWTVVWVVTPEDSSEITQWNRILLQKPVVTQLIKKLPAFYGKWYSTVFIRDLVGLNSEVKLLKNFVNNHFHMCAFKNRKDNDTLYNRTFGILLSMSLEPAALNRMCSGFGWVHWQTNILGCVWVITGKR
jgi:hypothetical protein